MATPEAKAMIRADNRRLDRDLRQSKSKFRRAFVGIGRGIKKTLGGALTPLGVGVGTLGVAAIAKDALAFEQTLLDLEVQAGASGKTMMDLRATIESLAKANGQSSASLASATAALVNLQGESGLSSKKLAVLSEAALATSTPVEELAGLVFSLQNAFGLESAEDLRKGLDAVITAGKRGAIPLAEMNQVLQQVSAQFANFGATGTAGATDVAVLLQILRTGFGSAAEAGTGLAALMNVIQTRQVELAKAGIKVKDSAGNFLPLLDAVDNLIEAEDKLGAARFKQAFGSRAESRKTLNLLRKNLDSIDGITEATKNSDAIAKDAEFRRQTAVFRITKGLNDAKQALLEAFTPERIDQAVVAFEKIADAMAFMVAHAEKFILLWASLKVAGAAAALSGMAASAGAMAASLGIASFALGGIAALAGGFALGSIIDEKTGASSAIADKAADVSGLNARLEAIAPTRGSIDDRRARINAINAQKKARAAAAAAAPQAAGEIAVRVHVDSQSLVHAEQIKTQQERRSVQ